MGIALIYLLTQEKWDDATSIFKENGFEQGEIGGRGLETFDLPGETRDVYDIFRVHDTRKDAEPGDVVAGLHLKIDHACKDNQLSIPKTTISIPHYFFHNLFELPASRALKALKESEPYAILINNMEIRPDILKKLTSYKPKITETTIETRL